MLIRKILYISFAAVFALPAVAGAHTGAGGTESPQDTGFMMMEKIEGQVLGDELHKEMEKLMVKMMGGEELSQEEIDRMAAFMEEYPGPYAMMMDWLGRADMQSYHDSGGMMGSWLDSSLADWVTLLLLWALMALGIVGLWKWIQKK